MKRILWPLIILLTLVISFTACGSDGDEEAVRTATNPAASTSEIAADSPAPKPDTVTFMAGFKPQANLPFAGAYVAQKQGFFAEENLDVEIRHSNPGENFRFLAAGEVQFSTADASALLEKWTGDPQLPIVSIALIGQTGQQGFAVLADSGIRSPADWAGKTAGFKGAAVTPDYLAILDEAGIERSSVQEVKVGFEPQVLTEGQVDIFPVFVANEPDTLQRLGYGTTVFTAADYGAPTLGLTYVAMEDYIAANPDITRRFVRAALKGIAYAEEHPAEAIQIVMRFAPQEDPGHQRFMLDTELDMARAGNTSEIGAQTLEQWQALHDYLVEYGGLPTSVADLSRVFWQGGD